MFPCSHDILQVGIVPCTCVTQSFQSSRLLSHHLTFSIVPQRTSNIDLQHIYGLGHENIESFEFAIFYYVTIMLEKNLTLILILLKEVLYCAMCSK